jgi:hydrogenase nickel incorporation protein HypA/HybF
MHEMSLVRGLVRQLDEVARAHGARRVIRVRVGLGVLSHLSPEHVREHFAHVSKGTVAEGAALDVVLLTDPTDPRAQDVILESAEIEEP